jgi:hypothetical protein
LVIHPASSRESLAEMVRLDPDREAHATELKDWADRNREEAAAFCEVAAFEKSEGGMNRP